MRTSTLTITVTHGEGFEPSELADFLDDCVTDPASQGEPALSHIETFLVSVPGDGDAAGESGEPDA